MAALLGRSGFPESCPPCTALTARFSTALHAELLSLLHAILAPAPPALALADDSPAALLALARLALVFADGRPGCSQTEEAVPASAAKDPVQELRRVSLRGGCSISRL
jgi:hypothetical protein